MRKVLLFSLLLSIAVFAMPARTSAQIGVSITIAPPVLPVYAQPICPAPGYLWTPGYWAWGPDGYFWVPGTWVEPPTVGLLWTPGYWGWGAGVYLWHAGYWGPHVGFYGGVNYGFGYGGVGFAGGEWRNGAFFYNRSVTNINITNIHNVYNRTVVVNNTSHVSFNGGQGGLTARPTAEDEIAARDHHVEATSFQTQQEHVASTNHNLLASVNHGKPAIAATSKPGDFSARSAVAARSAGPAPEAHPVARADRPPTAGGNAGHSAPNNNRADRPPNAGGNEHAAPTTRSDRPPTSNNRPSNATHNAPAEHQQTQHESTQRSQPQHQAQPKSESRPKSESKPEEHPEERPH